jgi:hypothetical protein
MSDNQNRTTKVTIHETSVTPSSEKARFGQLTGGKITLTGPMQPMTLEKMQRRFVFSKDGNIHIYWDYIIPDGGMENPYIKQASKDYTGKWDRNPQKLIERRIGFATSVEPELGGVDTRPTPPSGSANIASATRSDSFWFLEVTWDDTPTGLVLFRREDGSFERVGFFFMGRNNYQKASWIYRGSQPAGARDWNWDEGLRICTITIV